MADQALFGLGFLLVIFGFILAFVAAITLSFRGGSRRNGVRGGGAIIIGPFPIIFGSDKQSVKILFLLSIILIGLLIFLTLIPRVIFR